MKMCAWYRIDVAFKLRLASLGEKLTYEERLQRMEELMWMRDEIKNLIEEKEYEPAIQESANESAPAPKPKELVSSEGIEWKGSEESSGGIKPCRSGGSCEGWQCKIP
jgi:hypothetical protein